MKKLIFLVVFMLFAVQIFAQSSACKPAVIEINVNKYTFEYDAGGKLIQFTDRNEDVYKLTYDDGGKLVKMEDYESDGELYAYYVYKDDRVENYDEDGLYITYRFETENGVPVKVWEVDGDDEELMMELVWRDGNIVQETVHEGSSSTVYKLEYDDKANPLEVLQPIAYFEDNFMCAEYFSANNIVKVSYESKVVDLPLEYNTSGCPVNIPRNQYAVYKVISY